MLLNESRIEDTQHRMQRQQSNKEHLAAREEICAREKKKHRGRWLARHVKLLEREIIQTRFLTQSKIHIQAWIGKNERKYVVKDAGL